MADTPLPFELESLAERLRGLPVDHSPAELRSRVIDRVAAELDASRGMGWWGFAGGAAAAIVLWMNLSWVAARQTSFAAATSPNFEKRAAWIEELRLGISPDEARRQAVLTSLVHRYGPDVHFQSDVNPL